MELHGEQRSGLKTAKTEDLSWKVPAAERVRESRVADTIGRVLDKTI